MLKPLTPSPRIGFKVANRIAIVASRYNEEFVEPMLAKVLEEIALIEPESKTQVVHAPGSFEIPYLACQLIQKNKPDAIICLGVIFQGATGHANLIAASVSDALCRMSLESGVPIIHGVLLLQNEEQAQERCLGLESNRGTEAARAAIQVIRASAAITTSGT
jgi:6,7-dimethyl-8-ribityllumazine synthase